MTDLQIKYWQLQEAMRANKAQESLKERATAVEERLGAVNQARIVSEIEKISHEINNIDAKTDLTEIEKKQKKQQILERLLETTNNLVRQFTGQEEKDKITDSFLGWLSRKK